MIVPVDISVKRYYRVYVTIDEDDDDEMIEDLTKEQVINDIETLDKCLDPDLDVEDDDIEICYIDRDGIMEDE